MRRRIDEREIPESDWKVLRDLKSRALERLCERILGYVRARADVGGETCHERFLKVFEDVGDGNAEIARVFDGLRRSNALQKLIIMRAEGLISAGEFARFSEATRSAVESSKGLIVLSKFARP